MKLLLTSAGLVEGVGEHLSILLGRRGHPRVCFIPTAADPEEDKWFVDSARKEIQYHGFDLSEVDLKTENERSLNQILGSSDIVYVNGGNTFYLMDWVRKSGFDRALKTALKSGIIYVGVSAGSIVAGPNIESSGWELSIRDADNCGVTDLAGLNLIPFVVAVHFVESDRNIIKRESMLVSYPVVAINDKQAVYVNKEEVRVVGPGDKVFFNGFKEK